LYHKKILFLCAHNAARSQMAEGLVNGLYSKGWKAFSAGSEPTTVHPLAIEAMKEVGVDISSRWSKPVTDFKGQKFDVVVTLCTEAAGSCPFFPGDKIIHKEFPDPAKVEGTEEQRMEAFRKTRDAINAWLKRELPRW
jgi:arsenate reductase (thioredoxin)